MLRKLLFLFVLIATNPLIFGQAPGDDCASAVPITLTPGITVSTGQQTTLGLTDDFATTAYDCIPPAYGGAVDGVYTIDVTQAGNYTFAFTTYGTIYKSATIHNACPPAAGNCEGGLATGNIPDGTPIVLPLAVGTYYIVIDGWVLFNGVATGVQFELEITSPIANNDCANAIELCSTLSCSYTTYTNQDATDSGIANPGCANYAGGDVWFSYVVNSTGELTIDTNTGIILDSGLAVYSGSCGSLALVECDDFDSSNGAMSSITLTGRIPGETLYIRVWEDGNDNNGEFGICITTPIPAGDNGVSLDCQGEMDKEMTTDNVCAPTAFSSNTISGNLSGQPTANRLPIVANTTVCGFAATQTRYEVIDFTVPVTGVYTFLMAFDTFDGQGYIVVDDGLFVPGSCATGTFVVGDDDSGPGVDPQLTINLTAGINYSLITTEFTLGSGDSPYTWGVTGPGTPSFFAVPPVDWYAVPTGGSVIASGPGFNPVGVAGSGLTDTNTPGVYSYYYACPDAPAVRTQVDFIIGKVWLGGSADWTDPTNWSEGTLPDNTKCVYIPSGTANDPIIDDNINADGLSLTIANAATLTVNSDLDTNNFGGSITIQDYVEVLGTGSLVLQDGASLIQVYDATTPTAPSRANSGNIIMNRNADIRQTDYVYWSSPVGGFDVSQVYGAFTPTNRIYEWIPTTATGFLGMPGNVPIIVGDWNPISSGAMSPGKGYIVQGPTNHTVGVSTASAQFSGVPNNGVITQALSSGNYSGGGLIYNPYGTDNLSVTPLDDNWNLIGNPYPSALDTDDFLTRNPLIEGAVHLWTHGTAIGNNGDSFYDDYSLSYDGNDYLTYNLSGSSTYPNESASTINIASGQGFFVLAVNDNETGSVTFDNDMRARTISNTAFFRNAGSSDESVALEKNRIWLNLIHDNSGASASTMVGYIEGATEQKDRLYDAYARESNNLSFYSKIQDERMIIQGRPVPFNPTDQVPLGAVITEAGQYTIAISGVDGLFLGDQDILLEDTYTGVTHNLKVAPYFFNVDQATDFSDRFILRYSDESLSLSESEFNTVRILAPNGEFVKVTSGVEPIQTITVYDLLGRALVNETNLETKEYISSVNNISGGAFIVQVTLSNGKSKTQKVILKQ